MSIPRETDAKHDHALRGTPLTVYHYLVDALHPTEWREVKQLSVCSQLRLSERTVRVALNILTTLGYIERQPIQPSSPRRYRLVYSRPVQRAVDSHGTNPAA